MSMCLDSTHTEGKVHCRQSCSCNVTVHRHSALVCHGNQVGAPTIIVLHCSCTQLVCASCGACDRKDMIIVSLLHMPSQGSSQKKIKEGGGFDINRPH